MLRFQNVWTGAVSNVWENPAIWSCGSVPYLHTDVLISSGTVVISSNATNNTFTVQPGVNVTVNTGYALMVLH